MAKVKTAVFPVGGMGTRFLPATKAMPKEMMPIVDRPLIQFCVEEARECGIERMIFVTGRQKHAIENHFDHMYELEELLRQRGKDEAMSSVQDPLLQPGEILFTRQMAPLGLGHAVWCARHVVQDEPFAVLLADDFILGEKGCLKQMMEAFEDKPGNYLAAMDVPDTETQQYGIVEPQQGTDPSLDSKILPMRSLVEKPVQGTAPSNLAVIGRYILMPSVIENLARQEPGAGGEIQLTDGIMQDIRLNPTFAFRFDGERYDCGSKKGFVDATARYAQRRGLSD